MSAAKPNIALLSSIVPCGKREGTAGSCNACAPAALPPRTCLREGQCSWSFPRGCPSRRHSLPRVGLPFLLFFLTLSVTLGAEVQLVNDKASFKLFSGGSRRIELRWRNPGNQMIELPVRMRLVQTTSATAAAWSGQFWI